MFTGFASENTPAVQVWDFFNTFASTSANRSVFLPDDCAPIQYFKTGATNASAIQVYLPTAPIEGKQIKIVNANYTSTNQLINVYSSDASGTGTTNPFIVIGSGQILDLCYSKNFIYVTTSGQFSTGWISLNQSPSGSYAFNAVVLGGNNNSSLNSRSSVIGGSGNTASGQSSGIFAGGSNSVTNTYAVVVGGFGHTASGNSATVVGGQSNTASGFYSGVFASGTSSATATIAVVVGADTGLANGNNSTVIGGQYGTSRSIVGNFVTSASASPVQSLAGAQQAARLIIGRETTNATTTTLRSNSFAVGTTNQVILPNNSAYYFSGTVIANVTGGGDTKAWTFDGAIKRGANAASTALVGTPTVTSNYADAGAAAWTIALAADTTNGGLQVTVTGAAATTIRWVCKIETTEVTY